MDKSVSLSVSRVYYARCEVTSSIKPAATKINGKVKKKKEKRSNRGLIARDAPRSQQGEKHAREIVMERFALDDLWKQFAKFYAHALTKLIELIAENLRERDTREMIERFDNRDSFFFFFLMHTCAHTSQARVHVLQRNASFRISQSLSSEMSNELPRNARWTGSWFSALSKETPIEIDVRRSAV